MAKTISTILGEEEQQEIFDAEHGNDDEEFD
jgi:hypothetical protein